MKSLDVVNIEDAKSKVSDITVFGNGDLFKLMSKASSKSQEWMKSTSVLSVLKVMEIANVGCVLQVTTQNKDNVAEAVTFIPGVKIESDSNGNLKLVKAVYSVNLEE